MRYLNKNFVELALAGDYDALIQAFRWCDTPQGNKFWAIQCERLFEGQGLEEQAERYLRNLLQSEVVDVVNFVCKGEVEKALSGDASGLKRAFNFSVTQQGSKYWLEQVNKLEEGLALSPEAKEYLENLLTEQEECEKELVGKKFEEYGGFTKELLESLLEGKEKESTVKTSKEVMLKTLLCIPPIKGNKVNIPLFKHIKSFFIKLLQRKRK